MYSVQLPDGTAEHEVAPESQATTPSPTDLGRRDRKKNATRRALKHATLRLVAERGYSHVTVEDIAEAADVSTRTFFNYFPSKESAVVGADPERTIQMCASLLERPAPETPVQALGAVLVAHANLIEEEVQDIEEGRESWLKRFSAVRKEPELLGAYVAHVHELERSLARALSERLGCDPETDLYPTLVTATVFAASRTAAMHWTASGGIGSLSALTGEAIALLEAGLPLDGADIGRRTDIQSNNTTLNLELVRNEER